MSSAERMYRLLLRAYPAAFREEFGREMLLVFHDQRRDGRSAGVAFWGGIASDVLRSAPALRLADWRARRGDHTHRGRGTMKGMAILAVVIGLLEAVNSSAEAYSGGLVGRGAVPLLALVMTIAAGVVLVYAGIAMLRRSPSAALVARTAAVGCLMAFAFIQVVSPVLSVASRIVGFVFPVAMLLYLWRSGGRGRATRLA